MDFGRVDEIWCFIVIYLFELYNVIDKDGKEISGIVTEIVTEDENSVVLDQGLIVITVEGELSAKSILVIPGILKSQEKK